MRQVRLAIGGLSTSARVAPSPPMDADLSLVDGADVLLIFMESYGAVSYDRPEFARQLVVPRAELEAAVHATNRQMVSAFVESTTFGGSSWLAHISLLSGVEVRDHETNAALMHEKRETLATVFKRRGYRTIALMPGLKLPWPEGSFYGFDQTYNAERIKYPGPEFGWFDVPDQFALAWFDQNEMLETPRAPVFLFFPTLSTHFPFNPTPPYQPDWRRMLTPKQYDVPDLVQAYSDELDWVDFGPAYVKAMTYSYTMLSGYLRRRADRDLVLILAGDHQPPAAVSGEGQPWDVPVHVIARTPPGSAEA
jgi:phosphoglycerol transferase MdoB-like AlkP superfamily enzyme